MTTPAETGARRRVLITVATLNFADCAAETMVAWRIGSVRLTVGVAIVRLNVGAAREIYVMARQEWRDAGEAATDARRATINSL